MGRAGVEPGSRPAGDDGGALEGELGRSVGDTREKEVLEQPVVEPSCSSSGPLGDWCSEVMVPRGLRGDVLPLSLRAGNLVFGGEPSDCAVSVLVAVKSSWSPDPALGWGPEDPVHRFSPSDVGLRDLRVKMVSGSPEMSFLVC